MRTKPRTFFILNACVVSLVSFTGRVQSFATTTTYHEIKSQNAASYSTSSSRVQMSSTSARDLLYQDQQDAMEKRALFEETLFEQANGGELKAPNLKGKPVVKSGTGFGGGSSIVDPRVQLAKEQAKVIKRDGVIRIDNALSSDLADDLREYVLEQQSLASSLVESNKVAAEALYGVENQRASRCDLQLSLLRGGYAADSGESNKVSQDQHVLADVLLEILGKDGSLRHIYESLVSLQGELYELASVITNPGSKRQKVHPDLPFKNSAPLYVVFLALQDVTEAMGPTTFLLGTHTKKENARFHDSSQDIRDKQISSSGYRLSTLKKGDCVIFDARILHCGNANDPDEGSTRALFNFSFRNPKVTGDLGYKGSIRPRYVKAMTLQSLSDALAAHSENKNVDPFAKYGNGIDAVAKSNV